MNVRTNADGFRGPPPPAEPATILFIGDSFTFGWGVSEEQRFTEKLAGLLGEPAAGRGIQIVNAGHWMYAFDQQLVLMRELIARHRPQVIVQGFYWIHVRTLFGHRLERNADGALQAVLDPRFQVSDSGVLKRHSDWLEHPPLGSQLVALAARAILNRGVQRQAADWVDYMRPGSTRDEALWELTDRLVGETAATLRAAGIAYVPFLIPASVEVGGRQWSHVGWRGMTPPSDVDVGRPAARLAEMFKRHGTVAVELAAPMRGRGGASLYYLHDGHWNAEGHAVVGELLAPAVRRALTTAGR